MPDLNANDLDAASKIIAGTARSMGVDVEGELMSGQQRGKRFRAAYEQVDRAHHYPPAEAVALLKQTGDARSSTRRSRSTSASASTSATPRSSSAARSRCPTALGKDVTVAVFAEGDAASAATEAGADFVGAQDLAERVEDGWTDFDVAIATPDLMGQVGRSSAGSSARRARCRTRRSARSPTTSPRPSARRRPGKVEYRTDRQAIVHLAIGKASFDERALLENYAAVVDEIVRAKPAAAKGRYLLSITLATTMGPGIRVDASRTREAEILVGGGERRSRREESRGRHAAEAPA